MSTFEWMFPADSDAWPCPEGCGGLTEDEAGGPCKACWDKLDDPPPFPSTWQWQL